MFLRRDKRMLLLAFGEVNASGLSLLESLVVWQFSFHLSFLALSFVLSLILTVAS